MLKCYGGKALEEGAARADELAATGDEDGTVTWHQITAAVQQLANNTPTRPLHQVAQITQPPVGVRDLSPDRRSAARRREDAPAA